MKKDLKSSEIRKKSGKLKLIISEALSEFYKETGVVVSSLDINISYSPNVHDNGTSMCSEIKLGVKI